MSDEILRAGFVFHGDIRQFLRPGNNPGRDARLAARATGRVDYPVLRRASLKDAIEALGVPHTEVGALVVDGAPALFGQLLVPGTEIHVHPVPQPCDVTRPAPLRPVPLSGTSFLVDANVGRLAALLRLLGQDAAYDRTWTDKEIADVASREGRIVLTRDRALLHRSRITHARLLRAQDSRSQLLETVRFFGLRGPFAAFSRCLHCNVPLKPVAKAEILPRLEPLTRRYFDTFHACPRCTRIYWPGSHHDAMRALLRGLGLDVA